MQQNFANFVILHFAR